MTTNRVILILFIFFFLGLKNETLAQNPDLKFKSISTEDGLSNASANVVYQDSFGFLWVGTRQGLNRFDGNEIVRYLANTEDTTSIQSDNIFDIIEIAPSKLLLATGFGVEIYDVSKDEFSLHTDDRLKQGKDTYQFRKDTDGSVWAATEDGLFHVFPDSASAYFHDSNDPFSLGNNFVRSVTVDEDFVYVVTSSGVNILNKKTGKFRNRNNDDHLGFRQVGRYTYDIFKSQSNDLWFGSIDSQSEVLINRFNLTNDQLTQYRIGDNGLKLFFSILSFYEDESGIYVGTNGGGLYLFDETKNWFHHIDKNLQNPHSLNDSDIWGISADRNGNIWISTDGGGVNQHHAVFQRFERHRNNPFDDESLGSNDVHGFFEDENHLWVGNNNLGLSRLDKSTGKYFNYPFLGSGNKSLLDYTVLAVSGDNMGNVWVGSYEGGLSKLDPKTGIFEHLQNKPNENTPLPSNYVTEIKTRKDEVWIGTAQGLAMYNTTSKKAKAFPRTPITNEPFGDVVNNIEFASDDLLWAASSKGLFSLDISSGQFGSTHTELDSMAIYDLTIQNENLWLATRSGLARYSKDLGVKWFGLDDGLSSLLVQGVETDSDGQVWCTTSSGLNLLDPKTEKIYVFGLEDGLLNDQFNSGSIYKNDRGILYAGGLKGFESWDPTKIQIMSNKPKVVFSSISILEESQEKTASLLGKSEITLEDDDDFVTIHFFSDEIIEKQKTHFSYRIRELNEERWLDLAEWKVQFTDLKSGTYTLDVRTTNYDGVWSPYSTLLITVQPPIYATSYAILGYLVLFVLLIVGRDRYLRSQKKKLETEVKERTSEIEAQKNAAIQAKETISDQRDIIEKSLTERESLLKEIHHRVKNNLQIIASLLYLQSGKFANQDYKKVLEEGQGRVRSMALIHQKLYENEDLKNIPFDEYLSELVTEIRSSFGPEMGKVNIEIDAENVQFDIDTAIPLGLIVNEMATNAFKYAFNDLDSGSFSISIHQAEGEYVIKIQDDGRGIPESVDLRKVKSLGLRLVRMLSQQLEGEYQFETTNGTSFQLKFAA